MVDLHFADVNRGIALLAQRERLRSMLGPVTSESYREVSGSLSAFETMSARLTLTEIENQFSDLGVCL